MSFFYGELVQDQELAKIARLRKKQQEKQCDELLEDEVWLLFKKMGCAEMNKDRNFRIQAGPITKQIDVFAKDENNVFVVECKASVEGAPVSRKDIHEISNLKRDITDSIRKEYKDRNIRVSFIIATRDMQWSEDNENLAKKNGIFVWKEADLKSYGELVEQLGVSAKFQIYSILFENKKIPELREIKVPAIFGGGGEAKYYSFIIEPAKLFPFAYVHRRESAPNEVAASYQRMVKRSRLKKIEEFISKGGHFPNNIIISFTRDRKPRFDRKAKVGDITYGILTFPPYYASAWVIDGQHRLYGYARSEKKSKDTVPVLAFESLPVKDQAKLFVEINEKQVAVTRNLLWDLYPDIYHDSEEKEHQIKRAISLIVRKLNSDPDSPLRDHIRIPSVLPKGKEITNLTMTTVCDAIEENNLINQEQTLLYTDDYDLTVDFACERLKVCFNVIGESFPEDWGKGDRGLLRSNIGTRILFHILRALLLYLKYKGQDNIYRKKDLTEFKNETKKLLNPMLTKLKDMSDASRSEIRSQTGKGRVLNNAREMAWLIKEEFEGFGLELLRNWAPPRPEELSDEDIRQNLESTEINLRGFIAVELKKVYGDSWWQHGIPQGVKNKAGEKIEAEIKKTPWKEDELRALTPERKLNYIDTPDLRDIIQCGANWHHFKNIFIDDKEYTGAQFKSFEFVRNKYQHFAEDECDEITKNLGYWGMKWIGKFIAG